MAANCTKTIRYFLPTRTTDLATNTTLGTATRHDFAATTLTIPETGSRSFLSVILKISYRDNFTVANAVTGVRMGIKLGAVAFADTDRSFSQANTGDHLFDEWSLDCTSYFTTNFGAGTSQTCQASIAVSTTTASNIGGNITAELIITYVFDSAVGTTRVKTIGFPITSHSTTLTTTQQELGLDGINPPAANQIPAFNTLLKEASVSIQQVNIVLEGCDANTAGTTALAPAIQIDAAAESVRGSVGQALTTSMMYRDVFLLDTATFLPSSAHSLKMRDTTTTARWVNFGAIVWVTYTYNASTTTRMLNQALIPFSQAENDEGLNKVGANMTASGSDPLELYAGLDIQEPGTITLEQSGVVLRYNCSTTQDLTVQANTQTGRTYTAITTGAEGLIIHRGDNGSGSWTLARGANVLRLAMTSNTAPPARVDLRHVYALILYSSDVPAGGTEVGNSVLVMQGASYTNAPNSTIDTLAASQTALTLFSPWKLNSAMIHGRMRAASGITQIAVQHKAGEWRTGWTIPYSQQAITQSELYSFPVEAALTCSFNWHSLYNGAMVPTATHRVLAYSVQNTGLFSFQWVYTVHNIGFTVAGTVTNSGVTVPNGTVVQVYAGGFDFSNTYVRSEFVTQTTTTSGSFSVTVPDNTRSYFVLVPSLNTASAAGTPGASSFSVAAGKADFTNPSVSVISLPVASTDPLIVSVSDASAFAMFEVSVKDRPDGRRQVAYHSVEGFVHPFQGRSTITGTGTPGDPFILTLYRRGRWPGGLSIDVRVQAVDAWGNGVIG